MPKYCYYCDSCKTGFETTHSIKEKLEKCEFCGVYNALKKIPSIPINNRHRWLYYYTSFHDDYSHDVVYQASSETNPSL